MNNMKNKSRVSKVFKVSNGQGFQEFIKGCQGSQGFRSLVSRLSRFQNWVLWVKEPLSEVSSAQPNPQMSASPTGTEPFHPLCVYEVTGVEGGLCQGEGAARGAQDHHPQVGVPGTSSGVHTLSAQEHHRLPCSQQGQQHHQQQQERYWCKYLLLVHYCLSVKYLKESGLCSL